MPTVFGQEPTKEELLEIMREAHEKDLWKPNANPASQKDKGNDPVANAFERSSFIWEQIAARVLNTCGSDEIVSLPQRYLKQVEKILLQKDGKGLLGAEMFSKDPVSESLKQDIAQYMGQCCHGGFLGKHEIPNLEAFLVFFHEKLSPFVGEKGGDFTKTIDAFKSALLDFGNIVQKIRSAFEKKSEGEPDLKVFLPLMEAFREKKEALLQIGDQPHPRYERTTFDYNDNIKNFLKRIEASEWIKKLNAVRRATSFESFKPKDFKAEEEKAKENFGILGLDMNLVKYTNPFKSRSRKDQVGAFLKQTVECFEEEIRSACKHIGTTAENNLIGALEYLYSLTKNVWNRKQPFEPESVTLPFKKAMLACDIEGLISRYKPKRETNTLHKGLLLLKNDKGIDTDAVEKSIYDAYISHFEENNKKHYYAEVTALWNLTNHRISFIKTVREMEASDYKEPEAAQQNAAKQVTEWRLKQEEYVQEFRAADVNFYGAFFGVEKKEHDGKYIPTAIGAVKQPGCMDVLENLLKDYGLWESIVWKKKKEIPQNPNDKEQNTIVEDKKEPETIQKETIPQEGTQLSNEKEVAKPTRKRRTAKNDE